MEDLSTSRQRNDIPKGLCRCGCGQATTVQKKTNTARGYRKGDYALFVRHHAVPRRSIGGLPLSDLDIFYSLVDKSPMCWVWKGTISSVGRRGRHVRLTFTNVDGVQVRARRFAYELGNGTCAMDSCVMSACKNPLCVRPDHLYTVERTFIPRARLYQTEYTAAFMRKLAETDSDWCAYPACTAKAIKRQSRGGKFSAFTKNLCTKHFNNVRTMLFRRTRSRQNLLNTFGVGESYDATNGTVAR